MKGPRDQEGTPRIPGGKARGRLRQFEMERGWIQNLPAVAEDEEAAVDDAESEGEEPETDRDGTSLEVEKDGEK